MTSRALLASWGRQATPVADLLAGFASAHPVIQPGRLSALAINVARSVLVDPSQPMGDIDTLIEHLIPIVKSPLDRLAVLDLVNALSCAGAQIRPELEAFVTQWLVDLVVVGPPLAKRVRVGLAAIVYGELDVATQIAPEATAPFYGGLEFRNDVLAVLGYLTLGARVGAVFSTFEETWRRVAGELGGLCATGQLDEPAVLWLARVIYQCFGKEPVTCVATRAHDYLCAHHVSVSEVEKNPDSSQGHTLAGGVFCIEQHIQGLGSQKLWLGREIATGTPILVASDTYSSRRQDVPAFRRAFGYQVPGVFELAYVGPHDVPEISPWSSPTEAGEWATVEKVTAGSWLPWVIGAADPWTGPRRGIELGVSAGRILVRAAAAGVKLAQIRPELMWADRRDGHFEVNGLSPRAMELFARKTGEMVTYPLFDRFYLAPEADDDPDDRAVAYSLAVMVAEWATGRYPFAVKFAPKGVMTAKHTPIDVPRPLRQLLEATIRFERDERPRLAEFVDALGRVAL